ncbi:MAG TPA: PA2169 family four-helix-bundle protein [Terracidiphilus sp.]
MGSPSKDMVEVEGTLRTIIESLVDGQEGFQKIGEELKDETLKRYFLAESLKRAAFRGELEEILHQEGVKDVKETGSAASAFVRMWTGLKTALGAGDASLLEAADEAEEATVQAYADALNKYLPEPIREVLGAQAVQVEASHEYVKAARAGNKSAS